MVFEANQNNSFIRCRTRLQSSQLVIEKSQSNMTNASNMRHSKRRYRSSSDSLNDNKSSCRRFQKLYANIICRHCAVISSVVKKGKDIITEYWLSARLSPISMPLASNLNIPLCWTAYLLSTCSRSRGSLFLCVVQETLDASIHNYIKNLPEILVVMAIDEEKGNMVSADSAEKERLLKHVEAVKALGNAPNDSFKVSDMTFYQAFGQG
ncbi:unnamed protein product [Thelazia callipaeda]|uniref:AMP-binding_C domain-containing protein n=1 Tax=Thelazia callipaeda TaxID=103827 RepID=A0A0N5CME1_THECL|nr:unnamed protein product [Thelazia callipaeda]